MMWDRFKKDIEQGAGTVKLSSRITGIEHSGSTIERIRYADASGIEREQACSGHVVSSIPLKHLVTLLVPSPPQHVVQAAERLVYRAFIIVVLIVKEADLFPDQWIYVHSPDVEVGRIQNFKNWSKDMVPSPSMTSLGMEYFCNKNDHVWNLPDVELVSMASEEIEKLGLASKDRIVDTYIVRQQKAYPVYDDTYQESVEIIREYLSNFDNLQTIGRNGTHRYNNMDHSVLSGIMAAQNIAGNSHDIWKIEDDEYLEIKN